MNYDEIMALGDDRTEDDSAAIKRWMATWHSGRVDPRRFDAVAMRFPCEYDEWCAETDADRQTMDMLHWVDGTGPYRCRR